MTSVHGNLKTRAVDGFILAIVLVAVFFCLVPFLHIIAVSLSSNGPVVSGKVTLFPIGLSLAAYAQVISNTNEIHSLVFTIELTVLYTVISMIMTTLAAYPLSKRNLRGRKIFMFLIIFTMYFEGGIIPNYILVKDLGLLDTMWALILPGMVNAFYLIIMISFLRNLPDGLLEAAEIDGSSHVGILTRIVLPLSLPVIATLSLFYAVGRWNGFMDALIYITNPALYPIQLNLYELIFNGTAQAIQEEGTQFNHVLPATLQAADVMFATVPIMLVYPWLQRYFISGVTLGGIKE